MAHPSKDTIKYGIDGVFAGFADTKISERYTFESFVLYKNGVALGNFPVGFEKSTINNQDSTIFSFKKRLATTKSFQDSIGMSWSYPGGYTLKDSTIIIQVYRKHPGFSQELFTYNGIVKNDSTIYIISCNSRGRPEYCRSNYYLHLLPIARPDSTNLLMNKNWYWSNY